MQIIIGLIVTALTVNALAQNEPLKEGWSEATFKTAIKGCTESIMNTTKQGYVSQGIKKGNANAETEFIEFEPIFREELEALCACIIKGISKKLPYSPTQNYCMEDIQPLAMEYMTPPNGLCQINGAVTRIKEKIKKHKLDMKDKG